MGCFCRWVIIHRSSIDVGHLLVESPFRKPYLPDFFDEPVKILFSKLGSAVLQPLIINHPSFDSEILDDGVCPLSELHGTFIVYLEADSNDHLEIVVYDLSRYLSVSFGLNYPVFSDSCLL